MNKTNRTVESILNDMNAEEAGYTFQEALADHERYLNQDVIDYMYNQLNDPNTRQAFLNRVRKYHNMSNMANDKVTQMTYEYLRYLPPEMAKNFAREFYQKEIRSGTHNEWEPAADEVDSSIINRNKWYDIDYGAGNPESSMGIFGAYSRGEMDEELESEDIFDVLLNGNHLSRNAKILLIVNLMFGTGPGMRSRASNTDEDDESQYDGGLDVKQVLSKVPPEYKEVEDKIKELSKLGFSKNRITPKVILSGDYLGDKFYTGLLGTKGKVPAQKELIDKVSELADDLGLDVGAIFGESYSQDVEQANEVTKDKMFLIWLQRFLSGEKLLGSQLITVLVRAVASNLEHETKLSKVSKRFKFDSIARITREYLKLIKRGGEDNISEVQAMVLAPVLRWKLKNKNF